MYDPTESCVGEYYAQAQALVEAWTPVLALYDDYHDKLSIQVKWHGPNWFSLTPVQKLCFEFKDYKLHHQILEDMSSGFREWTDDFESGCGKIAQRGRQGGWLTLSEFSHSYVQDSIECLTKATKEYERVFIDQDLELWELLDLEAVRVTIGTELDTVYDDTSFSVSDAEALVDFHEQVTRYMDYLDNEWKQRVYDWVGNNTDLSRPTLTITGPGVYDVASTIEDLICVDTNGSSRGPDSITFWPLRPMSEAECQVLAYVIQLVTGVAPTVGCTPEPELAAVEAALRDYFGLESEEEEDDEDGVIDSRTGCAPLVQAELSGVGC